MKTQIEIIPFWKWFWVTLLGFIIGTIVTTILAMIIQDPSLSVKANGVIGFGLGIGLSQYFVLKKQHDIGTMWIWGGTISIAIACWFVDQLEHIFSWEFEEKSVIIGIKMSVGFVSMGIGQALLLKRTGYKDWYIFALSTLVPFLTVASIGTVAVTLEEFYAPDDTVFGIICVAGIVISYTFFNAFAFKYIQEQNIIEEQTFAVESDSVFYNRNDEEQNTTKPIEKITFWRWFRATVGGFLIGTFVVLATERYARLIHLDIYELSLIVLPAFVAYMQYRALSEVHNFNKRWIGLGVFSFQLASLILLGFVLILNPELKYSNAFLVLRVFVGSFILGIYHGGLLKKLNYTHTYMYSIGYSIAFVSSLLLVSALAYINKYYELPVASMNVPSFIIVICSYAICTSLAFSYIQKQTFKDVVLPEDKWDKWRRDLSEKEESA